MSRRDQGARVNMRGIRFNIMYVTTHTDAIHCELLCD